MAVSKAIDYLDKQIPEKKLARYRKLVLSAFQYLRIHQKDNGAWLPLWFGNQQVVDHTNPVYGTARVITYLNDAMDCNWISKELKNSICTLVEKGTVYLLSVQNDDGSWGGDRGIAGSVEETSLALSAIIKTSRKQRIEKGFNWLDRKFRTDGLKASPIGLYFASLWYHEKMYPLVAYLEAVSRALELSESSK